MNSTSESKTTRSSHAVLLLHVVDADEDCSNDRKAVKFWHLMIREVLEGYIYATHGPRTYSRMHFRSMCARGFINPSLSNRVQTQFRSVTMQRRSQIRIIDNIRLIGHSGRRRGRELRQPKFAVLPGSYQLYLPTISLTAGTLITSKPTFSIESSTM